MTFEDCVLLRLTTGKDATMTGEVLTRAGLAWKICGDTDQMLHDVTLAPGTLIVAEEALGNGALAALSDVLDRQAPWSDVPVIVLARNGANSLALERTIERLPNVTVLERPVRMATLTTVVRSVLRARSRQYELRAHLAGLQLADQRKTEFLATLAHELRNPLAPVTTALALLSIQNDDPAVKRHHDMIGRQVRYMSRLVDDLLEVSRITRGMIVLQRSHVELGSLVDEAIEMSRPLIDASRHQLHVDKTARSLLVDGDPTRLVQVLGNLLTNAAKYTLAGGTITVRTRREHPEAIVEVIDNGAGLEASMLESVFEMFVQVNSTTRTAQGGLGIGLTLVRSLIDLHGGSVTAHSAGLSHGSTFVVRLPLLPEPAATAATVLDATPPAQAAVHLRRARVLVVDDNRDAADSLGELLSALGAQVTLVYSGEQALEVEALHEFDFAVLDIGMPGMDGCEVARRFRARHSERLPVLIALTGWGQESDRLRVADAGFDHHLLKPVDLSALMHILSSGEDPLEGSPG